MMSSRPPRRRLPETKWKPTVPNPEMFQLPKSSKEIISIKPPQPPSEGLAAPKSDPSKTQDVPSPENIKSRNDEVAKGLPTQPHDVEPAASSGISNGDFKLDLGAAVNESVPFDRGGIPVLPSEAPSQQSMSPSVKWRPDIFVQAFVPQSFLAVNNALAKTIISEGAEGINFPKYVSMFASPLFLPSPFLLKESPSFSGRPVLPTSDLTSANYGQHFTDCIMLDLEAQTPEVRSYDLFGVRLDVTDDVGKTFSLRVPGLREGAPRVVYGDIVLLRQLIVDPRTNLPQGMDLWLSGGNCAKGLPAPGFTGYEINATVIAVDKRSEHLHLRAKGLNMFIPMVFNVSFVVQGRWVYCLQTTVADIANELSIASRHASQEWLSLDLSNGSYFSSPAKGYKEKRTNKETSQAFSPSRLKSCAAIGLASSWLRRMLFPQATDGVLLGGLPSANFKQSWYDMNLNYEQMVCNAPGGEDWANCSLTNRQKAVDAIQSRSYGSIPYLINGPPGTGKTKTVVEAVTQLANDADFTGTVLVCAPSDPAADTLILRLRSIFSPKTIFRLNEFSRTFAEVPQELMPYCYVEDDFFGLPTLPVLMSYKVIVTTCGAAGILIKARVTNRDLVALQQNVTGIIQSSFNAEKSIPPHWTALFVDEAAQATEPEILIPLAVVAPHTSYICHPNPILVLAGDQFQLGPRTYDKTSNLHVSLFERLSNCPVYASHPQARKTVFRNTTNVPKIRPPFVNLVRNYRSHPAILAVPSSLFYHNTLIPEASNSETLNAWRGWQGRRWPVLFTCNSGIDDCQNVQSFGGAGWYNRHEAHKAISYAADMLNTVSSPLAQADICIMSPFRAQVNLLRKVARASNLWDLNIGPMEAFQGLESRVVIICTTRARTRFLSDDALRGIGVVNEPKKFNVAVTRAKEGLIVIGNPWVLARDSYWMAFLRFCWRNNLWHNDETGRDPRIPEGDEADISRWKPNNEEKQNDKLVGLEAALLFRDAEPGPVSKTTRMFMGVNRDDEMWMSGMAALEALRFKDETKDEASA